jgi:hypothetical protein
MEREGEKGEEEMADTLETYTKRILSNSKSLGGYLTRRVPHSDSAGTSLFGLWSHSAGTSDSAGTSLGGYLGYLTRRVPHSDSAGTSLGGTSFGAQRLLQHL